MAYGIFRFMHEFLRATPQIAGPFSGYQIVALSVAALGLVGFVLRRRAQSLAAVKLWHIDPTDTASRFFN
jgi:phosphatidylglycerol:prolipoprotein diacylglycerol transferase